MADIDRYSPPGTRRAFRRCQCPEVVPPRRLGQATDNDHEEIET